MHVFDFTTANTLNLNTSLESPCATSYLIATVMFALTVAVSKIFAVGMCMHLTFTFRIYQGQM